MYHVSHYLGYAASQPPRLTRWPARTDDCLSACRLLISVSSPSYMHTYTACDPHMQSNALSNPRMLSVIPNSSRISPQVPSVASYIYFRDSSITVPTSHLHTFTPSHLHTFTLWLCSNHGSDSLGGKPRGEASSVAGTTEILIIVKETP